MAEKPKFDWIKRRWKLLIFIAAVTIVVWLPNPESLIIRVVERAGLVLIVARGLIGHYQDFQNLL